VSYPLSQPDYESAPEDDVAPVRASLKWFNSAKGFGFVIPEDNPADAFLHVTQLQKLGLHGLGEGAEILCVIDYGPKGATVKKVLQIINPGELPPDLIVAEDPDNAQPVTCRGIVKWYKNDKGFGFITPSDGMKDIFIHKSCLDRDNVDELHAGQSVRVTFKTVDKGREAISVALLSDSY
jgi:cold shock protein